MSPEEYCQSKAAASGSSFYYSFLFLSPEQRCAVTALYAFCREVDDVVDECSDPGVARLKLHWWREELGRIFRGTPAHPVGRALVPVVDRHRLPLEQFQEIVDGMEMDLDYSRYPSFKELLLYCHRAAGVVGLMTAEIFGYADRRTQKYAHNLAIAFQLTNILRDVREDAMRGRVYLPTDELERFGVTAAMLNVAATPDPVRELLSFQAARARDYYAAALHLLPETDRYRQRGGLIMAAIYQSILDEIERDGFRILEHRVALPPLRKLWIAWRTALHERRRRSRPRMAAPGIGSSAPRK